MPQAALQVDQAGNYVMVVDDPTARPSSAASRRARTQDADVVIEPASSEGEQVIVDGIHKVRPGQVVAGHAAAPATAG